MKKSILGAITALVLIPVCAIAQDEDFAEPASVEANHSVSLYAPFGLGLHYAYEQPIARRTTVIGRAGADVGAAWGSGFFGSYSYWMIAPSIDIEPRFYYGLDRRENHGRSTEGNAGSFLALNVTNILPFGYVSESYLKIIGGTVVTPQWGLRRMWGGHWLFEFTAGVSVIKAWSDYETVDWYPAANVRFGYKF